MVALQSHLQAFTHRTVRCRAIGCAISCKCYYRKRSGCRRSDSRNQRLYPFLSVSLGDIALLALRRRPNEPGEKYELITKVDTAVCDLIPSYN